MQVKPKRKLFIFLSIICLLLVAVLIFIGLGIPHIEHSRYNEKNSIFYEATFKSFEDEKDNNLIKGSYIICVYESEYKLTVDKNAVIDADILTGLVDGDKISFRSFFEMKADTPEQYKYLPVIMLNAGGKDIVTFESSLAALSQNENSILIASIIFAALFFTGAILCILHLAGIIPKKPKE